eukprot:TRINITY_DN4054_c0_g1_i4.p1 TRINITY_DN4054_c0_g1~~TRINITY_DN4054_c0_g1_i4.p1  ORF type:complete len:218 (+),score=50.68 TRINITY_DN4054_c0_g1_i4:61-714(+)
MQSLSNPIKHSACSVTDVLCALERGEEMNPPFTSLQVMAVDDDGRTAFHWACAQRMMVAAQYLASHAHNIATLVNQKDGDSWTPLHSAASAGHVDVVEFLLQNGAKVDATTNEGRTPLFYAASKNHDLVVQLLLHNHADPRIADKNGATLVHRAASAGHIRILEILFSAKVLRSDRLICRLHRLLHRQSRIPTHDVIIYHLSSIIFHPISLIAFSIS